MAGPELETREGPQCSQRSRASPISACCFSVSPFYHYNRADYDSSPGDPVASTQHRGSTYVGGQASLNISEKGNDLQLGVYSFYQQNRELLGVEFNPNRGNPPFAVPESSSGSVAAFFLEDKIKPVPWFTISAGFRPTHFSGERIENSLSPRFGVALNVPRLNWTFRVSYGHYYQPLLWLPLPDHCCNWRSRTIWPSLHCTGNATKKNNGV